MDIDKFSTLLQSRVDEIVLRLEDKINGPKSDLVRLIESTRARTLIDVIECINGAKEQQI